LCLRGLGECDHGDDAIGLARELGELREARGPQREQALALLARGLPGDESMVSLATSMLVRGSALRLPTQIGSRGAPPFEAKIT
jgi:hypothetical protein